jgi:hypothetical protein
MAQQVVYLKNLRCNIPALFREFLSEDLLVDSAGFIV